MKGSRLTTDGQQKIMRVVQCSAVQCDSRDRDRVDTYNL